MIDIAPASEADLDAVRELVRTAALPLDGLGDVPTEIVVARDQRAVVGTAALETYGEDGLLRSVAVDADRRGEGVGDALVAALEDHASRTGLRSVYLLTDTAPDFFARRGYEVIARDGAPEPVMASVEWSIACGDSAVPMRKQVAG